VRLLILGNEGGNLTIFFSLLKVASGCSWYTGSVFRRRRCGRRDVRGGTLVAVPALDRALT